MQPEHNDTGAGAVATIHRSLTLACFRFNVDVEDIMASHPRAGAPRRAKRAFIRECLESGAVSIHELAAFLGMTAPAVAWYKDSKDSKDLFDGAASAV